MTVKKLALIVLLAVFVAILGFSVYKMVEYITDDESQKVEQLNKEQEALLEAIAAMAETTTPEPTATPAPEPTKNAKPEEPDYMSMFTIEEINDEIAARIKGKSYAEDATIPLSDLRYLKIMHYGFDGKVREGEMIVNKAIAEITIEVFKELFEIAYPIQKMVLIDEYDADDELSMADNNTSAFNFRFISGTKTLSNHAMGLAIDINPLYNPYIFTDKNGNTVVQPANGQPFVNRNSNSRYFIKENDDLYCIFLKHGFTWGGDWQTKKDYQHFEYALEN